MGEEAALADAEVTGQPLQRNRLQTLGGGEPGGVAQDRLAGALTSLAALVRLHGGF